MAIPVGMLIVGCSSSKASKPPASAGGDIVAIKLLQFTPSTLTVKAGTTVTWREDEPITHTVTSGAFTGIDPVTSLRTGQTPDGKFDHTLTKPGDTFSFTFNTPGTYTYFCSIHQGMNASVTVTP